MMSMFAQDKSRAIGMWGLALCLLAVAAGWMFMRFGQAWSMADLPESDNIARIVPAYVVTEIAMIPVGGKLIDRWGVRRVLLIAPLVFIIGSLLCIASTSVEMLVLFRSIQGLGAGLMLALAFTSVGKFYDPAKRGKCHELMTGAFAFGSLFASAVGYYLTTMFDWRAGFMVLAAMMAIGAFMAWKFLPQEEPSDVKSDPISLVLAAILFGAAALYTQMVNVDFDLVSIPSAVIAVVIIVMLILLMHHAKRVEDPAIPVGITSFEKKLIILMFAFSLCGLGLIQYFFKLYLSFYEFDIYNASFMFIFLILGAAGPSIVGSRKVFSTGIRPWVLIGSLVVAASLVLTHFIADDGITQFAICVFLFGMGLGFIVTEILCSLQAVVEKRHMGQHTGNLMAVRMIGILVGNAIVGSYIKEVNHSNYEQTVIDLTTTDNVLSEIAATILSNIEYAASSLRDGLLSTVLVMAVASIVLGILAYTLRKDDVEAIEAFEGSEDAPEEEAPAE